MEWLIDIIKEWVVAQAYATEAWVLAKVYATEAWVLAKGYQAAADMPEWITPYNVTGDLTPDASCTYFKAGTYGGKPYYRRQDGAYFIWWYVSPVSEWWISDTVGGADVGWWRRDPNIVGDYATFHTSGVATVSEGYNYLKTGFVDRGDPDGWDYVLGDFTTDYTWHDFNLSAIVPEGARAVLFRLVLRSGIVDATFQLRKKGKVGEHAISDEGTGLSGILARSTTTCACDENRAVQYRAEDLSWLNINVLILGWWL